VRRASAHFGNLIAGFPATAAIIHYAGQMIYKRNAFRMERLAIFATRAVLRVYSLAG
jgi:hypothetical protein